MLMKNPLFISISLFSSLLLILLIGSQCCAEKTKQGARVDHFLTILDDFFFKFIFLIFMNF